MNNIFTNKNYILIFSLLLTSSLLINLCNKIYQCSCFFVLAISMAYLLKEHYGNKLAFTSLVTALTITFCLTYNIKYNLYNKTYLGIITVSILSIFVSFAISTMLFNSKTHLKYFFTLGAAALIDGLIMSSYFIGKLDFAQVIMMFSKEALFRTGYITLAMLLVNLIQAKRGFIFNIVPK